MIEALSFSWILFVDVCLPIVVMVGIGILMDRKFGVDLGTLVKLNIHVFVPGFIFVKVIESANQNMGVHGGSIILFTLSVIFSTFLLGLLIAKSLRWSREKSKSFFLSTMFYNCGNWGIPMMALAYPDSGPNIHVFVLLTMNLSTFTIGMALASGYGEANPLKSILSGILKLTPVYAISLGFICNKFSLPVQDVKFIWVPLAYIDKGLVAVALVTLGVQLSKSHPPRPDLFISLTLIVRLLIGPLIALALAQLFQFSHEVTAILVLGAGAPTAINTALLAHDLNADSKAAASAVFYSTCLAIFSITIILTIQKSLL